MALDVTSQACESLTPEVLCQALASDGHCVALESLCTWDAESISGPPQMHPGRLRIDSAAAAALAAACPALTWASVKVEDTYAGISAALRALPGPGPKQVIVSSTRPVSDAPQATSLAALAEWAAVALGGISVAELVLPFRGGAPLAAVAEEQAAAQLAAALAAPERGLRCLRFEGAPRASGIGETPLLASLCRALTAESPLTELSLVDCGVTGAGAVDIAAALACGRLRLRALNLGRNDLTAGRGAVALFAALGPNVTLTELNLDCGSLGGPTATAALAASLRSNSTLRTLILSCAFNNSTPEGIAPVLGALASTTAAPSRCSLTALDISSRWNDSSAAECLALGLALSEPSCRLEALNLANYAFCDGGEGTACYCCSAVLELLPCRSEHTVSLGSSHDGGPWLTVSFPRFAGAKIARGLEAAGATSRLCFLDLSCVCPEDATVVALGRALAAQGPAGALRKLCLAECELGPAAVGHLAEGLRANSTLETLDLEGNPEMGQEGAAAIARGIAGTGDTASGVRALWLDYCSLEDAGLAAMLEAGLRRNATLTELNFGHNDLTAAGGLALVHWAAARFGVAPEDPGLPDEGVAVPGGAPSGSAGASGEVARGTGDGGAQRAAPDAARLSDSPLVVLGSRGPQPRPLIFRLLISEESFCYDEYALLKASTERIVERANAAADVEGWQDGTGWAIGIDIYPLLE